MHVTVTTSFVVMFMFAASCSAAKFAGSGMCRFYLQPSDDGEWGDGDAVSRFDSIREDWSNVCKKVSCYDRLLADVIN